MTATAKYSASVRKARVEVKVWCVMRKQRSRKALQRGVKSRCVPGTQNEVCAVTVR